ncbi:hypothetical protein GCM10009133_17650 [Cocleimonas flava]
MYQHLVIKPMICRLTLTNNFNDNSGDGNDDHNSGSNINGNKNDGNYIAVIITKWFLA